MTISLLQTDIAWGNPIVNQVMAEALLRRTAKSDVYVLPEMFSTGFATEPKDIAEKDDCSLAWMQKMARELDAAICGSVATEKIDCKCDAEELANEENKTGKAYYNRFYFVKPDGEYSYYDKRHLFSYGGEDRHYTCGNDRIITEFRGVRFLLQVCYDLRFPVFSRNGGKKPYDVALYVASWPTSRIKVWDTLLHARAIENQCYVAGVNRIGSDKQCQYSGGTMLIDAYGRTVDECPADEVSSITADLDIDALRAFRKKFPVLADADTFNICISNNN